METVKWFLRLPFWVILVISDLSDEYMATSHIERMAVPCITAILLFFGGIVVFFVPDFGRVLRFVLAGTFFTAYLGIGVIVFFDKPLRNYGSWQRRGGW